MSDNLVILAIAAANIGFFHTLLGPDHYLPFTMMAMARKWSKAKTALITVLCGIGHIAGSIILGFVGIFMGIAIGNLEAFEGIRGDLAAWLLIGFGLAYFVWGIRRAIKNKPHVHQHSHDDGVVHEHTHTHTHTHAHVHEATEKANVTPWALFIIFVLGPCEPLIPLLMYPAAESSLGGVLLVAGIFGITTVLTMLTIVLISVYGVNFLPLAKLQRYTHAIAGATICACGLAIRFLGL
jgi:nickel/cobalt transporter (NicO) family protein